MRLDLGADALVRAGSGLVYVALALAIAVMAKRFGAKRRLGFGLAIHAAGFGASFVLSNVVKADGAREALVIVLAQCATWTIAAAGLAIVAPLFRARMRTNVAAILAGVVLAGAMLPYFLANMAGLLAAYGTTLAPEVVPFIMLDGMLIAVTRALALAIAILLSAHASTWPGARPLAFALLVYPSIYLGELLDLPGGVPTLHGHLLFSVTSLAGMLVASVTWLAATQRGGGRACVVVALTVPALVLVGQVELVVSHSQTALIGIARIAAAVAAAIAIFHRDLLGAGMGPRATGRATLGTVALAALFIVAQVGQNFFAAQYGLLLGGVVAGALLFAASPIQRAIEARSVARERHDAPVGDTRARREEMYRKALRIALHDRVISRDEELHLFQLAEELGIGAGRAMELRHDVERERGGSGPP